MRKLLIAAAAAAFAGPAFAQPPAADDPLEAEIDRAIPPAEEVEAMAPALDRMLGVLLDVDVGPLIDAADPYRRRYDHGRPGRTLGALGSRDDPYFEDRLRSSLYGGTADLGRMMQAFRTATPGLVRSLREAENAMGAAIEDYERRRGYPPEPRAYPDE